MAKIYNSDVTKGLAQNAGIQQMADKVPGELAEKIVPTMESNPALLRKINTVVYKSTPGIMYTTPKDRDFYLTGLQVAASNKTASQDSSAFVTVQLKGKGVDQILTLNFSTSALIDVGSTSLYENFNNTPILLERGSNITLGNSNCFVCRGVVFGYIVETSNT